jgi:hypothetical protein
MSRKSLEGRYGTSRAAQLRYAEASEISGYGRRPDRAETKRLFPFLGGRPVRAVDSFDEKDGTVAIGNL